MITLFLHGKLTTMRRVLATDFGIWPSIQNMERASDLMVSTPAYWSRLANYLLMYDQIVIPTGNLQILAVLRIMLGEAVFDELVRDRAIVLARYDQWFGYVGNGGGLSSLMLGIGPNGEGAAPNIATSFFRPLEEAIDTALVATNPPSTTLRRQQIKTLLIDNVSLLPAKALAESLKDEVYKDILGSPYLRDMMSIRNRGRSLDKLKGIKPNQVTIFNPIVPPEPGDSLEVHSLLRVAFENFVLGMGGQVDATEITGDEASLTVLQAKGQRLGMSISGDGAFTRMQNISGVPDLGAAFATKQLSSKQLVDLRYSRHTQALRDWVDKGAARETSEEIVRRYVESAGAVGFVDSIPIKLLRFASTIGLGDIGTVTGAIASGVDSFLLSKWFPGKSPRLFMKQAKLMLKNSPRIKPPILKGRDRNQPCSCGSGKKLKHCCGGR